MAIVWQPIETAPRDGTEILLGHFFNEGINFHCMTDYWDVDGYWSNYVHYKADPTHWAMHPDYPIVLQD